MPPPSNELIALLGLGILSYGHNEDYVLYEVDKVWSNQAIVKKKRDTGIKQQYIMSQSKFNREEDKWKLNLMSTFTLGENILSQLQNKSGLDEMTFIGDLIEHGIGPLRISY